MALAGGPELQSLFGNLPSRSVVQSGAGLGIDQHLVAVSRLQGSEEVDPVTEPVGGVFPDVIRGKGAVRLIQHPDAGVVEPTVALQRQMRRRKDDRGLQSEHRISLHRSIGSGDHQGQREWAQDASVRCSAVSAGVRRGNRNRATGCTEDGEDQGPGLPARHRQRRYVGPDMADTLRFRNLDGSGPHPFTRVLRWAIVDRVRHRRRRSPSRAEVPQQTPDKGALRVPPATGLRLTWLGHASWLVQGAGTSVLIDPVLGPRAGGLIERNVGPGLSIQDLPPIAASLVSHNHYDHLDLPTLRQVGAPVVSGTGNAGSVRGLPCTELSWWSATRLSRSGSGVGLEVTFVPSQHWSRRLFVGVNSTLWGGFVVEGGGARIYHAGDTAYFAGFREIGERFPGLNAALLPIGAYDPEWFMRPQHMNPEDAVQAFLDLGAKRFVAMHWGTFKLTDEPLDEPPARLRTEWRRRGLPESALRIPAIGESLALRPQVAG